MNVQRAWLVRGYFDLSADDPRHTTTQHIRDVLAASLGRQLHIAMYPVGANRKHTFWWREGTEDYAEAQFFWRIDEDCPVLSVGVSIEKGREGTAARPIAEPDPERLDRATWDWQRLINRRTQVLETDLPQVAEAVGRPVNIRVRSYHSGGLNRDESRTFCFVDGHWFQRHRGVADASIIASHLVHLDALNDRWVDLYFALDIDPTSAEGFTAEDVASLLLRFQPIRNRLRP